MKGFSLPNISIPNISIPKISISGNIDAASIKNAITSAVPDISSITGSINFEGEASKMISDALGEGIDIPSDLSSLLK